MARPSEPLLRWLRQLLQQRKLSAPALAQQSGLDRGRVRQILAGADPMTVDELLQISKALSLSPQDLGLVGNDDPMPAVVDGTSPLDDDLDDEDEPTPGPMGVDPLGNHPRQLFEVAFALGCDFLFLLKAAELAESGVPRHIIERYKERDLPIKLDAAYHSYNNPRYDEGGITLALSFDALYECRFPWTAIHQFVFYPAAPPPAPEPVPEKEEPPKRPGRPFLRLVE